MAVTAAALARCPSDPCSCRAAQARRGGPSDASALRSAATHRRSRRTIRVAEGQLSRRLEEPAVAGKCLAERQRTAAQPFGQCSAAA